MKRLFLLLALTAAAASCSREQDRTLKVMTLNMRYDNPEDGDNNWRFRRQRVARLIDLRLPDLLGTQELLANQFDDLCAALPGYEALGVGREDGARAGEFNAVFFRRERFAALASGTFWLSEEPERPGSKGWDGACERLATWVVLRDGDGSELLFINTHLDHMGPQARREGVALLLRRIEALRAGRPVILTGDFNSEPDSEVVAHVLRDGTLHNAADLAAVCSGPAWTFSDFGQLPEERRERIDYIFVGGAARVATHAVLPDTLGGGYLSDHTPVEARLEFVR